MRKEKKQIKKKRKWYFIIPTKKWNIEKEQEEVSH